MRALAILAAAALGLALGGSAAETISLTVRPLTNPTSAFGSISSAKAGLKVTLQFKQCGLFPAQFRDLAETETHEGGAWAIDTGAPTNGVFRAVAGGDFSNEVPVKARPDVRLTPHGNRRYEVVVVSVLPFWRKRVRLQRFNRSRGTWFTVRRLVLVRTFGPGLIWSTTERFTVKLPKGTTIRAVLPRDQAKPCFIAGYSNLLVTK